MFTTCRRRINLHHGGRVPQATAAGSNQWPALLTQPCSHWWVCRDVISGSITSVVTTYNHRFSIATAVVSCTDPPLPPRWFTISSMVFLRAIHRILQWRVRRPGRQFVVVSVADAPVPADATASPFPLSPLITQTGEVDMVAVQKSFE